MKLKINIFLKYESGYTNLKIKISRSKSCFDGFKILLFGFGSGQIRSRADLRPSN